MNVKINFNSVNVVDTTDYMTVKVICLKGEKGQDANISNTYGTSTTDGYSEAYLNNKLVNVGTSVDSNYKTNILYSHNLNNEDYKIGVSWNTGLNDARATAFVPVKSNTTYYIRVSDTSRLSGARIYQKPEAGGNTNLGDVDILTSGDYIITTTSTTKILAIQFIVGSGTITTNDFAKVMITENDYQNYEPYLTPSIWVDGVKIYEMPTS